MQTDNFTGKEIADLPLGYHAAGIVAGIKGGGVKDMALIHSTVPAAAAGVFTVNQCPAAPVKLCRKHLASGKGQAIVVNSGVANAATGRKGEEDALDMAAATALSLGIAAEDVFVCSTGSIGKYLPMDLLKEGIGMLVEDADRDGGESAAQAIMTTDTRAKRWAVEIVVDDKPVKVTGIAKGAGMIEPDMATMLAFILTDADADRESLQSCLADIVEKTFNRITVDGDMSTNDTVLLVANGAAGNIGLDSEHADWSKFRSAVYEVASRLAWMIVEDGEGATKVATINVKGAASDEDAEMAARAVANSFLVKTAWAGDKPAFGRVIDALGYSGAVVDADRIDISYDGLPAITSGVRGAASEDDLRKCAGRSQFTLEINLDQGSAAATVYTCNITEEYVRINM